LLVCGAVSKATTAHAAEREAAPDRGGKSLIGVLRLTNERAVQKRHFQRSVAIFVTMSREATEMERGFRMRDRMLELWLGLLTFRLPEPTEHGQFRAMTVIRNE
jgi:hypothetical protein